jgi:phage shock protein E
MKFLRVLFVSLLLVTAAFTADVIAANTDTMAAKPLLIDVRTPAEWDDGHLDGAILIPYEKIGEEIGTVAVDKQTKINLYCRTGRRSGIALDTLKKLGYEDVTNLGSVRDAAEKLNVPVIKGSK